MWAGANYVAWNTRGTLICQQPPTEHVPKVSPAESRPRFLEAMRLDHATLSRAAASVPT